MATIHVAAIDTTMPGTILTANPREPIVAAIRIFATALLVITAKMGGTACPTLILSDATNDATEIDAEWVSTNPATTAPAITPASQPQFLEE